MPAFEKSDSLLSVAQAAGLLGVHPNTVRAWTEAGRLQAYRINARGDRRFRRDDVERLLVEDGPHDGAPAGPAPQTGVATFGRISWGLATTPTVGSVGRTIVEAVRAELRAERAAIYVVRDTTLRLAAHAGYGSTPPVAERALPTNAQRRTADDVELLLATRRGPSGLLVLDGPTADTLGEQLKSSLVGVAATALAGARMLGRARRELRRARELGSVGKELSGELDPARVVDDIVERTLSLFGADRAGIWLFENTPHPVALATRGLSDSFLAHSASLTPSTRTISVRALRDRTPQWSRNAHEDRRIGAMRAAYAEEGIRTVCIVPLFSRGATIGVLGLYDDTDRIWSTDELLLVQAFADQAAIAMQNARLYQSVADQAARMRSIQDLSARLNRLTDVRAIGEAIVAEARTLADYHDIRIYRVDRGTNMCEPIAFTREMLDGPPEDAEALLRVAIGEGFTGWVAEHGEPLLINDALDDDRGKTIDGTEDVPESMLLVPMLYEGQALGVIVLSQLGFNRFTDDDLQTMGIFAGYAAQAMANATTYEQLVAQSTELARRADSQRRLLEINERLLGTLDHGGVLESVADGLRDVVAYDNLSIYRTEPSRGVMVPVLTRELHAEEVRRYEIPFGRGLMGWAVEHAQPILANDALADPRALQIPGTPPDPEAVVVVPLVVDGEVLGALNVSRVGGAEVHFSMSDFELVQLFAAQASIALRNADAHHAMSQRAETDALTGLGNHGAFQRELGTMIDAAREGSRASDRRLALLMMDLDSFKAYNDRHGHPAGDELLHRIATAIYGSARSEDRVFRYGGDEFALILPGATVGDAARLAERIRRAVARLTASNPTPVTITIGVAGLPDDAPDRSGLIAAADTALFFGKRAGENRVVRTDQLPADVGELRGQLEELAATAVRESDDEGNVEHIVERAGHLGLPVDGHASVQGALLTITRAMESGDLKRGHADRVARLAIDIAAELDMDEPARHEVELASRLHGLDDRGLAELSSVPSLRTVAALVIGARQIVADGTRRGRRAVRATGRAGAHVVAAANAYDELASVTGTPRREAIEALRRHPATFRTDVLAALARSVNDRRDPGRRRREGDTSMEERGAA